MTASNEYDARLAEARPRLVRLAYTHGLNYDEAEDVAQEALVIAWRRIQSRYSEQYFDTWLNRICANVLRHHLRKRRLIGTREHPLSDALEYGGEFVEQQDSRGEPEVDLLELLDRHDLQQLLNSALGQLSATAREIVECTYLEQLPQREVADRLGLTISALEARLYRSRRQLRHVLGGALRPEAERLGVFVEGDVDVGWRETREWCNFCARRRMFGRIDRLPDGRVNVRFRCPGCSPRFGGDVYNSGGLLPLRGAYSFRPVMKRIIRMLEQHYTAPNAVAFSHGWQYCPGCAHPAPSALAAPGDGVGAFCDQARIVIDCPDCGHIVSPAAFAAYWTHANEQPRALRFIQDHPRWHMEPDVITEYDGVAAIRYRIADVASADQITFLAHSLSLHILAVDAS